MALSASVSEIGGRLPSEQEMAAANQLRQIIAAGMDGDTKLRVMEDGKKQPSEIVLTPALSRLLMGLLRHIGSGDAVTLVPLHRMMTTQQAADILNVSRPFLVSLLEKDELPYSMVGRHRRIKAEDLFAYQRSRDDRRSQALSDLAELDRDMI
ncbi:helix-turn-helix domain-containing protein [Pleomorphomonas sp. NRK KF1]|uniref:helix-turn-helix domain-containing protein n=1 Tax=Pleomorphomonas sp. NRK KF1 TaxID=2943000 RepID=UPI0035316BD4